MLNLLPESKKKELEKEYKLRRLVVILCFCVGTLFVFFIFSLPNYIRAQIRDKQSDNENQLLEHQIDTKKIKEVELSEIQKSQVALLQGDKSSIYSYTDLIDTALKDKSGNILINQISVKNTAGIQTVFLQGIARTRDDLVEYRDMLKKNPVWGIVELPIPDIGPAKNNSFVINLTAKN